MLAAAFAPIAAMATGQLRAAIAPNLNSPVAITGCSIRSFDSNDYHLEPRVDLKNVGSSEVMAVRIAITFFSHDAFSGDTSLGEPLTIVWPRNGSATIKPNGTAQYNDAIGQTKYPLSSSVTCSVAEVKLIDGSVWNASSTSMPSSATSKSTPPALPRISQPPPRIGSNDYFAGLSWGENGAAVRQKLVSKG